MRFVKISSNGSTYHFATTPGFDRSLASLYAQYESEHRPLNLDSFCSWLTNTLGFVSLITGEEIAVSDELELPF